MLLTRARVLVSRPIRRMRFTRSGDYWEQRYAASGNSGAGSYGQVAQFKADTLNRFVEDHRLESVIEFGCGDGNQLAQARYPQYTGLDVSRSSVTMCADRFAADDSKSFLYYDPAHFVNHGALRADLALSLDVILHLVEDRVFERHMRQLFEASTSYVAVFSSDQDDLRSEPHVRHRRFTRWIEANQPSWKLISRVENPFKGPDTLADFFIYARR